MKTEPMITQEVTGSFRKVTPAIDENNGVVEEIGTARDS